MHSHRITGDGQRTTIGCPPPRISPGFLNYYHDYQTSVGALTRQKECQMHLSRPRNCAVCLGPIELLICVSAKLTLQGTAKTAILGIGTRNEIIL